MLNAWCPIENINGRQAFVVPSKAGTQGLTRDSASPSLGSFKSSGLHPTAPLHESASFACSISPPQASQRSVATIGPSGSGHSCGGSRAGKGKRRSSLFRPFAGDSSQRPTRSAWVKRVRPEGRKRAFYGRIPSFREVRRVRAPPSASGKWRYLRVRNRCASIYRKVKRSLQKDVTPKTARITSTPAVPASPWGRNHLLR